MVFAMLTAFAAIAIITALRAKSNAIVPLSSLSFAVSPICHFEKTCLLAHVEIMGIVEMAS